MCRLRMKNSATSTERFLRWRNTVMLELYDFEHRRERLQLAREMVGLDPRCVLCRDALADSLYGMAREVGGVQAEQPREEGAAVREHCPDRARQLVAKRDGCRLVGTNDFQCQ